MAAIGGVQVKRADVEVTFNATKSTGGSLDVMKMACEGRERDSSSAETVKTEKRYSFAGRSFVIFISFSSL